MQPPKGYFVVELTPTGTRNLYPMKEWCRQFPEEAPQMNPNTTNSQALRRGFIKMGWVTETTETQVLILRPGTPKNTVQLIENEDQALDEQDTPDSDRETVFELEWQLRDFIAHNIESQRLDGKPLRLYVDSQGDGIEYSTGVGRIDILALDSDDTFVVYELKRGRVADKAIGQISRYMGWVQKNLAGGRTVKGVIVAKVISQNLRHAIVVVPNVSLFEYQVAFTLNQIQEADGPSTGEA